MVKLTKEQKIKLYTNMVRVRKLDNMLQTNFLVTHKIRSLFIAQEGQEAVGVGGCTFLNKDDYLFFSHRGMGIAKALPKGVPAKNIVAEFYGKATGTCRSLSGHRTAYIELGVSGPSGSVGMDLPLAAGAGIAARRRGKGQVVASFFGDGAMNQGTFHTSILMSANWKLPVVWICENNGYFGPTPVKEHYPKDNIADLAFGYGIPGVIVDGQDVIAVYEAVQTAVDRARAGEGSSLIECKTLCFSEDIYTGPRNMEEARKNKDPITLFRDKLLKEEALTQAAIDRIDREATEEMEEADRFATESPLPGPDILRKALYAD
jgi:pyruvate dehydrogenase E1 component alpha subunit